eukprot:1162076-Pelagomonas_calceolata.AAC.6
MKRQAALQVLCHIQDGLSTAAGVHLPPFRGSVVHCPRDFSFIFRAHCTWSNPTARSVVKCTHDGLGLILIWFPGLSYQHQHWLLICFFTLTRAPGAVPGLAGAARHATGTHARCTLTGDRQGEGACGDWFSTYGPKY